MRLIDVSVLKEWIENWFTKNRLYHPYAKNNNIPITELYDILEQMPPAEPERKTGKWIKLDMHAHLADHKCTACGQECYVPTCMGEPMYTYCPNCGARMEGENETD